MPQLRTYCPNNRACIEYRLTVAARQQGGYELSVVHGYVDLYELKWGYPPRSTVSIRARSFPVAKAVSALFLELLEYGIERELAMRLANSYFSMDPQIHSQRCDFVERDV